MNGSSSIRKTAGRSGLVSLIGVGIGMIALCSGCDEMLTGGYGGYYDYGFMPDYQTVQSVLDYRSSVYESANDAWSDYIRG